MAVSAEVQEVIKQYDPHYRSWSADEALLDITDYVDAYVASSDQQTRLNIDDDTAGQALKVFTPEQIEFRQRCAEAIVQRMRAQIFEKTSEYCVEKELKILCVFRAFFEEFTSDCVL